MTISSHYTSFAGYPIVSWSLSMTKLNNPSSTAFAIRLQWEHYNQKIEWVDLFKQFLNAKGVEQVQALIIGAWNFQQQRYINQVVEVIATHHKQLPNLKALFIGDITYEENEISWIRQGDLSPILNAFPNLEHLATRGSNGLNFGKIDMPKLKSLQIESGGLNHLIVKSVAESKLPALEKLVLWLGAEEYGANTTIIDLQPFYKGENFPKLKYLGLCNSEIQDNIAIFMATAPILEQLETLDFSMGNMSDAGALALIKSPSLFKLKHLNLCHNYFSDEILEKLNELNKDGLTINTNGTQEPDEDMRYIQVSE